MILSTPLPYHIQDVQCSEWSCIPGTVLSCHECFLRWGSVGKPTIKPPSESLWIEEMEQNMDAQPNIQRFITLTINPSSNFDKYLWLIMSSIYVTLFFFFFFWFAKLSNGLLLHICVYLCLFVFRFERNHAFHLVWTINIMQLDLT